METNLQKTFPLLFPRTTDCSELDGLILVAGVFIRLRLFVKDESAHVCLRWNGDTNERTHRIIMKLDSNQNDPLLHFLTALKENLEKDGIVEDFPHSECSTCLSFIVGSLDIIGWEKIESVDEDLKCVSVKAFDEADRKHVLQVYFNEEQIETPLQFVVDFPEEFTPSVEAQKDLTLLYSEFQEKLKRYQQFWNNVEEIDENTWVLEPEKPTRMDTRRRIALSKKVSILVTVYVCQPSSAPDCEFYGPDKDTTPLRNKFVLGTDFWNEDISVLSNLKNILDVTFPSVLTTAKDEIQDLCAICYSFLLNGNLPEKTCENMQCRQTFHMECLYEWLHKLSTTRHSFNILFGECPLCSKPITCKLP